MQWNVLCVTHRAWELVGDNTKFHIYPAILGISTISISPYFTNPALSEAAVCLTLSWLLYIYSMIWVSMHRYPYRNIKCATDCSDCSSGDPSQKAVVLLVRALGQVETRKQLIHQISNALWVQTARFYSWSRSRSRLQNGGERHFDSKPDL